MDRASSLPLQRPASREASVPSAGRVARQAGDVMQIASPALPFNPQPKPERAPRHAAKKAKQDAARAPKLNRQRKERIENYGRREGGMTGPEFKRFILARDRGRCISANCETPTLGVTAHHIKHVGAGGKNDPENGATLCATHHDAEERGTLSRQEIRDRMITLGHIALLTSEELDEFDERLSVFDGRKGA